MDIDRSAVDLLEAHDQATRALEMVEADPAAAALLLRRLADSWADPLEGSVRSHALDAELVPYRAIGAQVRRDLARAQIASGDAATAVRSLEGLIVNDSTDEDLWFQLAHALVALDRRRPALDAIKQARDALRDRLGLDLGPRLVDLELAILNGEVDTMAGPTIVTSNPLARVGLPGDANDFVARPEVEDIALQLRPGRMVTVVGPGGVGKTRCAVAAARRATDSGDHPDGQWFVDLSSLPSDSDDVSAAVAMAIGLNVRTGSALSSVVGYLTGRSALLVLDNCEHVVASVRDLVGEVAQHVPRVALLATSRVRIDHACERVVALDVMSRDDAIDLFTKRVNEIGSGPFATGEGTDLCAALDNYPLAIELAVAWTRSLSPAEIIERLDTHRLLVKPDIDLRDRQAAAVGSLSKQTREQRHRSLDAALAWSLSLIGEPARHTLERLTIFDGDFDLAAAEATLQDGRGGAGRVVDELGTLVEHHLLQRDHHSRRFRMFEPVRQVVHPGVQALASVARRHAEYFADIVVRIEEGIFGPDEPRTWELLRAERVHLRAAVRWAVGACELAVLERMMRSLSLLPPMVMFIEPGEWALDALEELGGNPGELPFTALAAAGALAHAELLDRCDAILDDVELRLPESGEERLIATLLCVRMHRDNSNAANFAVQLEKAAERADMAPLVLFSMIHRFDARMVDFADSLGQPAGRALTRGFAYMAMDNAAKRTATGSLEEAHRFATISDNVHALATSKALLSAALFADHRAERGASLMMESIELHQQLGSRQMTWGAIDAAANVLAINGTDPYAAAVLWAATDRVQNPSVPRLARDARLLERVDGALGQDECLEAAREGRGFTMDEAAVFARKSVRRLAAD